MSECTAIVKTRNEVSVSTQPKKFLDELLDYSLLTNEVVDVKLSG